MKEECRCDDRDGVICVLHSPMHVYSESAFLYRDNPGKPICIECPCWDHYAGQLIGCNCTCHELQDDYDNDPWARR